MSYPEAVTYLLDGEQGQLIERGKRQETKRKPIKAGKGRQAVEKEQTEERKEMCRRDRISAENEEAYRSMILKAVQKQTEEQSTGMSQQM